MPAKLYVGNLAFSVTNEDLEALFGQIGKIDSVAVVTDKFSGQSRGFGFVQMADSNEAARAISELNGTELKLSRSRREEEVGYLPFRAGKKDLTVLVDRRNGDVIRYSALRPWEY